MAKLVAKPRGLNESKVCRKVETTATVALSGQRVRGAGRTRRGQKFR